MAKKVLKKFFNLIEDSKEYYNDFLNEDFINEYIVEIDLEIKEFLHTTEKYTRGILSNKSLSLSNTEYNCLYLIGKTSDINSTSIAKKIKQSKGNISKIIKKLENKKLITVYQKKDNKRQSFFRLTSSGEVYFNEYDMYMEKLKKDYFTFFSENFTEDELEFIYNFFVKINKFRNEEIAKETSK